MTGLNAGVEQLTCVSDNVANMNTTAYKTSRVDFQDIWYRTKTTGTNSTRTMGGTNPYQIGVGVRCASISKDFQASSVITTGRKEDMALTGNGWFTVVNSDGKMMLTRDGTFARDENGYLCTANGCKLLGMDTTVSLLNSTTPIKLPTQIKVTEHPTKKSEEHGDSTIEFGKIKLGELNALSTSINGITPGTFKVYVGDSTTPTEVTISVNEGSTVDELAGQLSCSAFSASVEDGFIRITPTDTSKTLTFESGTSNFVAATNIATAIQDEDGNYDTKVLNYTATISEVDDITADTTKQYKSFSVGLDGLVTVEYSDGSILTIKEADNGVTYFQYQDPNSIMIDDDPSNTGKKSLYVDPNVLVKANMQIQVAKVLNDNGLVAEGNNQYSIGVDSGQVIYTAANKNGTGAVVTGALESSNVDLAQQLSNMILAQRLVQANSQVFNGANSMLETLVYLGR